MRKIEPTQDRLRELFEYDPLAGVLTRKISQHKGRKGSVVGTKCMTPDGYRFMRARVDGQYFRVSRLVFIWVTGSAPAWPNQVDHRDRNGWNNIWTNLKEATPSANINNRRKLPSKSGEEGILASSRGWRVRLGSQYGRRVIGHFGSLEEAVKARDNELRRLKCGISTVP